MGVQTARSLTPHKRRRAVALANGHYESIIMSVGISQFSVSYQQGEALAAPDCQYIPSYRKLKIGDHTHCTVTYFN